MSLYGLLNTSVSGMNAQSNLLGTVSDNIANSGTTGYKAADTEFSSLLLQSGETGGAEYQSGSISTTVRYGISQQGALNYTSSPTDLAIQGNGFFVVNDSSGQALLTRAGGFHVDATTGDLVNAGGYTLMGYDVTSGAPTPVLNGTAGLVPINLGSTTLAANPSTNGTFSANLPSAATAITGSTAGSNVAGASYTEKSSLVAYDNLGGQVTLDMYLTKTSDSPAQWEMAVYNRADAPASGDFPYASGPLATQTLSFDASGRLSSTGSISIPVPNGANLNLDISDMSQLATGYTPLAASVNGNAPVSASDVSVSSDGTVSAVDQTGQRLALYKLPIAYVAGPDELSPVTGNAFAISEKSGNLQVGFAGEGGLGAVVAGATEQSTVDMASELTRMIVAQRDYTANSKVFQTGAELLDVLMNLKR